MDICEKLFVISSYIPILFTLNLVVLFRLSKIALSKRILSGKDYYLIAMKNFSLSSALFQNVVTLDGNFLFSWGGFGF